MCKRLSASLEDLISSTLGDDGREESDAECGLFRDPPPLAPDRGRRLDTRTRYKRALITVFDMEFDPASVSGSFSYMNCQQEIAPSTERRHWQIYVENSAKHLSMKGLKELFGATSHIEFVGVDNGASSYCLKDETAVPDTRMEFGKKMEKKGIPSTDDLYKIIQSCESWDEVLALPRISRVLNWAREVFQRRPVPIKLPDGFSDWRPWQQEEFDAIALQDDRKIRYLVDPVGGAGKSVFAKRLILERDAFYCNGGKKADIIHAYEGQEYVVFDLSRALDQTYWPYQVMEEMKNGLSFSGKYNSSTKRFNPAKIVVLTNEDPDLTKHSKDRWSIRYLSEKVYPIFDSSQANDRAKRVCFGD